LRIAFANISLSNYFPSFIVRWILNFVDQPTHENHENWYPMNKSDFTVYNTSSNDCAISFVYPLAATSTSKSSVRLERIV
jgi:hypothetical protein